MGVGFVEGLAKAFSMILASEVGDKTFFLAALMAMRHPRRWVMAGSLSALWIMTLLSALFGWVAPSLLPRKWTHALATLLFLVFGVRSLWDGLMSSPDTSRAEEELREVEAQLNEKDKEDADDLPSPSSQNGSSSGSLQDIASAQSTALTNGVSRRKVAEPRDALLANGEVAAAAAAAHAQGHSQSQSQSQPLKPKSKRSLSRSRSRRQGFISPVFFQAFSLVFFGEWGDKSQIATIGLASEENIWGVALGGCLGHFICNSAAVLGGRHLATQISERMVSIFGGVLFLAFAVHSVVHGPHIAA